MREVDKAQNIWSILRMAFITPTDVKDLWQLYLRPLWLKMMYTGRRPQPEDFVGDRAGYESASRQYEVKQLEAKHYRRTFNKSFWDTSWDLGRTRYLFFCLLALTGSIFVTVQFWSNIVIGRAHFMMQLVLAIGAILLFMISRHSWHVVRKQLIAADTAGVHAVQEMRQRAKKLDEYRRKSQELTAHQAARQQSTPQPPQPQSAPRRRRVVRH